MYTCQPKFPWSDETNLCLDPQVQKGGLFNQILYTKHHIFISLANM